MFWKGIAPPSDRGVVGVDDKEVGVGAWGRRVRTHTLDNIFDVFYWVEKVR